MLVKALQWAVEIAGVSMLVVAGLMVAVPLGIAIAGAYLVYLSWEGSPGDDDGD